MGPKIVLVEKKKNICNQLFLHKHALFSQNGISPTGVH